MKPPCICIICKLFWSNVKNLLLFILDYYAGYYNQKNDLFVSNMGKEIQKRRKVFVYDRMSFNNSI